ncbi:MAG: deoxyribodipyrimidine photo-lyase [Proteobacteria bacterium]|nr:deoxyribodipyrimidine photo-lyase [Pseudomonadota bacterium]
MSVPAILWLRQDLRLEDNPALQAASSNPLIALYIWDEKDPRSPGGASRWWLHKSLYVLKQSYEERGVQFIFRRGNPLDVLKKLVDETKACSIYWNRCYEPYAIKRDQEIKSYFKEKNLLCQSFKGVLLIEPWEVHTKSKEPYRVFTPFWKSLQSSSFSRPLPTPRLQGWKTQVASESLEEWGLLPILWGKGLEQIWQPGEKQAHVKLKQFLKDKVEDYACKRDYPSENITSLLSPHLHWGEITPLQIWNCVSYAHGEKAIPFLRQLGWREFSYHLLFHFPELPSKPMRSSFVHIPWEVDLEALKAWQKGQTGYPLVDAGMRELWQTGGMHNRVRMIVASFLVKDLLLPWQLGEEWFWDTLVDADLANNAVNWQWVAGCGADAAPYYRIFNPVLQSQRFDPQGAYIKQWIPELKDLNPPHIHCPWQAPSEILHKAKVKLGVTYPFPIVDHALARKRALAAFRIVSP